MKGAPAPAGRSPSAASAPEMWGSQPVELQNVPRCSKQRQTTYTTDKSSCEQPQVRCRALGLGPVRTLLCSASHRAHLFRVVTSSARTRVHAGQNPASRLAEAGFRRRRTGGFAAPPNHTSSACGSVALAVGSDLGLCGAQGALGALGAPRVEHGPKPSITGTCRLTPSGSVPCRGRWQLPTTFGAAAAATTGTPPSPRFCAVAPSSAQHGWLAGQQRRPDRTAAELQAQAL